ncbi:MAG: Hpt domain-containing protein [Pseudomonadota bacterium]
MIDWQRVNALREEVGPEDFEEVVELFLQEVDAEIEALQQSAQGAELGAKLHFLKGSALSLGFEDFSALCQTGESSLASDPSSKVDLGQIFAAYDASRTVFLSDLKEKTSG